MSDSGSVPGTVRIGGVMYSPAEVARNYIAIGTKKVNTPVLKMFLLAIMAGVFIGFAGVGATTLSSTITNPSVSKFAGAAIFPGGLSMVLIAGSELFTGNCLIVIPLMEKNVTVSGMLRNWVVVWLGNLTGGILVSALAVGCHQPDLFSAKVAVAHMSIAVGKCSLSFGDAFLKGIACNFLVCIAVWMTFAAKSVVGKIIGLYFPVMFFVLEGFEHSIANMYYISCGLLCKLNPDYIKAAADAGLDLSSLTWGKFFISNLLPVTLGNILGGAVLVGLVYWYVYLHKEPDTQA